MKLLHTALFLTALTCKSLCLEEHDRLLFHTLEAYEQNLPSVKLPYGTWQAKKYDTSNDLYIFKNIRFAAPPVGQLRWAKPSPPAANGTLQTGDYGPACVQAAGGFSVMESLVSGASQTGEDCLFLDVYVPSKALKGQVKLPVINWIYGGAYVIGSKEERYDGTPLIQASGQNAIYIIGNYRVGSLGFLAGSTMEKEGLPNAGLWDQLAVLEWIQKYGPLFGADTENVSVWGESAGGGSILHHLTAFGGTRKALFKRAVIQSPAYDPQVDRKGQLEKQFQDFATLAGCEGKGLSCLRSASLQNIKTAQTKYMQKLPEGKPGFGPAADGDFSRRVPAVEIASGNVVKDIESIINSHTLDEAQIFTPAQPTNSFLDSVINHYWPNSPAKTKEAIQQRYAITASKTNNQREKAKSFIQFSTFTCSNRYISEAYKGKTYNLQYSRGMATHGSDLLATFYAGSSANLLLTLFDQTFATFAASLQSYLTSHTRTGDPNTFRDNKTIPWPLAAFGPNGMLSNVLNATDSGFELIRDEKTKADDCDFWKKALIDMTESLGL